MLLHVSSDSKTFRRVIKEELASFKSSAYRKGVLLQKSEKSLLKIRKQGGQKLSPGDAAGDR